MLDRESTMIAQREQDSDLFDLAGIARRTDDGTGASVDALAQEIVDTFSDDMMDQLLNRIGRAIAVKRAYHE